MVNGTRFLKIFSVIINPATVAMPLYIIAFVGFLTNYNKENEINLDFLFDDFSIKTEPFKTAILVVISLILMLYIPSIINAFILFITYMILCTIKIVKSKEHVTRKLIKLYLPFIILLILMISIITRHPYRLKRVVYSFYPEKDPQGWGYVGMLQKEVLEKAKIVGEADTKVIKSEQYLLTKDSNYTFIYLIGKTGFLFAGILVLTVILVSIKLIINAKNIKDEYGKYIIIGLSIIYIIQSFASILMNVNLAIATNVDIPLVTYGGVYFIVNILSIALLFSIYRRKDLKIACFYDILKMGDEKDERQINNWAIYIYILSYDRWSYISSRQLC